MKSPQIKISALVSFFASILFSAEAKIWRINNDGTKNPNFTTVQTAINSASVNAGDTLHIEPSATLYAGFNLTKRLVLIGNGYFLTNNPLLQANTLTSSFGSQVNINNVAANGSVLSGLSTNGLIVLSNNVSNITITHCLITTLNATAYTTAGNITIRKCFITSLDASSIAAPGDVTFTIENTIFSGQTGQTGLAINLPTATRGLFRNNTINQQLNAVTINNFYISNNIFTVNVAPALNGNNNIIRNNVNAGTGLPTGSGNQNGVDMTTVFVGPLTGTGPSATGDARFQLKSTTNPATAGGETIGTVITPACGAFGATDPYRLSGIPPVPSIYVLTVPTSVPPTDATMNITISTRSNN